MTTMNQLFDSTMFFGGNAPFVEEIYETYLDNPTAVPAEWRDYFDRLAQMPGYVARDVPHAPVVAAFVTLALAWPTLLPGLGLWDTAEFQTVGPLLGTAHPTGYPTYVTGKPLRRGPDRRCPVSIGTSLPAGGPPGGKPGLA